MERGVKAGRASNPNDQRRLVERLIPAERGWDMKLNLIAGGALLLVCSMSFASEPRFAWEAKAGAKVTKAMLKNVITVQPGSCDKINEALKALPAAGGTVKLLAGRYDCANPVAIERDNVRLVGAGQDQTVLRLTDWTSKPVIVVGVMKAAPETVTFWPDEPSTQWYPIHKVKNVVVQDVMVDGNRHNQYTEYLGKDFFECYDQDNNVGGKCDMDPENGPAKFVRNNGFTIRGADNVTVRRVRADRALSGGLVTEKRCEHLLVDGFFSRDSVFDGFAGYETKESVFRNMRMEQEMFSGISIDLGFSGNVFDHVELLNNNDNGIFSVSVSHNTFRNLVSRGNKDKGVYIEGKSSWDNSKFFAGSCDGQRFYNLTIEGNGDAAMRINDACKNIVIEKAIIKKTGNNECVSKAAGAEIKVIGSELCK
jgi:hypothetical protein